MFGRRIYIFAITLLIASAASVAYAAINSSHSIEIFSQPHTIDCVYKSMEGITGSKKFLLSSEAGLVPATDVKPELYWVTGGKIDILSGADGSDKTEKHLCHAYMKFDYQFYQKHPFYDPITNQYKDIEEFNIGDSVLFITDNKDKKIRELKIESMEQLSEKADTYNIFVDGEFNNFFVNGILVHNKCPMLPCT